MEIYLYSHTHWDREWYLSQNQFQYRLIGTVDEILDLLRADNAFNTFVLDGQTCVLEDYLEIRPERRPLLEEMIAAGQLAIGPWYTMPDVFLPDGEALIRNLARGWRDCREWGARFPNTGYVPDSFGHIEQLPQLLRGVGIDNFIFSRGRPVSMEIARGHKREFLWEAPDGSTVYAWHLPDSYSSGRFLPPPSDRQGLLTRIGTIVEDYASSHRPDIVLVAHGIDHCWIQRDIPGILETLPDLFADADIHHGTLEDAINAWKAEIPADLETYRGQLRGFLYRHELHGTLSSRMDNKLANEQAQVFIENLAEPVHAVARRYGMDNQQHFFRKAWRLILQNHAHDSICGCSRDRVHRDVNTRFREAVELGVDITQHGLNYLNCEARRAATPTVLAYGGLNGGDQLVDIVFRRPRKPAGTGCFVSESGSRHPMQVDRVVRLRREHTNGEDIFYEWHGCLRTGQLGPAQLRKLVWQDDIPCPRDDSAVRVENGRTLTNGLIRVTANDDGSLDLHDLRTGLNVERTHVFAHDVDLGGGYHFERLPRCRRRDTRETPAVITIQSHGPLRAVLEVSQTLSVPRCYDRRQQRLAGRAEIKIRSRLCLEQDNDVLKVQTTIVNSAANHRLRLLLPTGMQTREVHADASFAVHPNTPETWPAEPDHNFHPVRNMLDISENDHGLAFLGKGQHEYAVIPGEDGTQLELTLLRSVDFVFQCCTWETPEARMQGSITHEYALALHPGDWRGGNVMEKAMVFRNPAVAAVHGDHTYENERDAYATIGFYELLENGRQVPVDSNRVPWHPVNAHRDGWRRLEADRFVDVDAPAEIRPFRIEGDHVIVSAYKTADDGDGDILRIWSCADKTREVRIHAEKPETMLTPVDLREQPAEPAAKSRKGSASFQLAPFQLLTVRLQHP